MPQNTGATVSKGKFDPPYPRIGQLYFYSAYRAGLDIWKNHSMVAIRYNQASTARQIKNNRPDVLTLAANAEIVGDGIKDYYQKFLPEEWYMHRIVNGKSERIPAWGKFIVNLTDDCPLANFTVAGKEYKNKKAYQFLAEYLNNVTDWNAFDGLYFDGWMNGLQWYVGDLSNIDLNNDGAPDSNIDGKWQAGLKNWIDYLRTLSPTNKVMIAHESQQTFLNGNAFEFWTQPAGPGNNMSAAKELLSTAVAPQFNYANSYAGSFAMTSHPWKGTLTGPVFRADFTSAQIAGAFFGHDEGNFAHRWTFMHDEYEGDLGYPIGNATQIKDLWVRYFDNGVIISNVSNIAKSLCPTDLTNGPYYRFLGNQEPAWNNGAEFTDCINFEALDGIVMYKEQIVLITPIIIDDQEYNMTTAGQNPVNYAGLWTEQYTCGNRDCYGLNIDWGVDANHGLYAFSEPGTGQNTAIYKPRINIPGKYEIFEWHGSIENKTMASDVKYEVYINGVLDNNNIITVDQTQNQGQWNSLGEFDLTQGENNYIKISNNANGYVISDAIKFVNLASLIKEYQPIPPKVLSTDFNCDNKVDIQDFGILLSHWHKSRNIAVNYKHANCVNKKSIDLVIDKNNRVDSIDLSILLSCWGMPDETKNICWQEQAN